MEALPETQGQGFRSWVSIAFPPSIHLIYKIRIHTLKARFSLVSISYWTILQKAFPEGRQTTAEGFLILQADVLTVVSKPLPPSYNRPLRTEALPLHGECTCAHRAYSGVRVKVGRAHLSFTVSSALLNPFL